MQDPAGSFPSVRPASPAPPGRDRFDTDPDILAVAPRLSAEKNRKHIRKDTQRQILATAALFTRATILQTGQRDMKVFMDLLDRIPKTHGKSFKEAARCMAELLDRGQEVIKEGQHCGPPLGA